MLQLDLSQIHIGDQGVTNYTWPVTQQELHNLRDACLETSARFIQQNYKHSFDRTRILHITYIEIIRELLVIMRSALLQNRTQDLQQRIENPAYPYLTALSQNTDIAYAALQQLDYAAKTVPSPAQHIKLLRPFKLMLGHPVYTRKSLSRITDSDIVTFSTSPFMERHAHHLKASNGQDVTLCSLWEWYDFETDEMPHFNPENFILEPLFKDYLKTLEAAVNAQGLNLETPIKNALTAFTAKITHYADFYRKHLLDEKNIKKLPQTLWFGSNNPIHPRVLRACVQENGGYTVAHDHGRSVVAGISHGELATVFDFCDEFVTYSEWLRDHATTMRDEIIKRTASEKPVKFTAIPGLFLHTSDVEQYRTKIQPLKETQKHKTAMIITGVFMGEGIAGLNILPADLTLLDFQIQLIAYLKSQGYKVILKTHPENKFPLPKSIYEIKDLEITGGYVEDMLGDVDLICFDFLSSAFKSIVLSDKPMLFFDFGWADIPEDIKTELQTRIGIIPGGYNEDNKMNVDWTSIPDAVKNAQTRANKNTDLFLKRFYDMVET